MAAPSIERLDHLVIQARDVEETCAFYETVLGFRRDTFDGGRIALHFGPHKINVHPYPSPIPLVAEIAEPGTADLCFVTETPISRVVAHLKACDVAIVHGPVPQSGAEGPMRSVYFRDPNGNLIEVANYGEG